MNNLQIAIVYSSIIGSMLNEFEKTKKPVEDMKRQVKKFMFRRSRTNRKEFYAAIEVGTNVWQRAIDHFAEQELKIDAFSTIVALWSSNADIFSRFVNLTEKRIEKFSMLNDNDILDAELSGYKVAEYLSKIIKENKV